MKYFYLLKLPILLPKKRNCNCSSQWKIFKENFKTEKEFYSIFLTHSCWHLKRRGGGNKSIGIVSSCLSDSGLWYQDTHRHLVQLHCEVLHIKISSELSQWTVVLPGIDFASVFWVNQVELLPVFYTFSIYICILTEPDQQNKYAFIFHCQFLLSWTVPGGRIVNNFTMNNLCELFSKYCSMANFHSHSWWFYHHRGICPMACWTC